VEGGPTDLRVLASPLALATQPYVGLLNAALRDAGVQVDAYSAAAVASGRYGVWHLHWPELFLNEPGSTATVAAHGVRLLAAVARARRRGLAVVWTVHNLGAHDRLHPRLEPAFWAAFTRQVDGTITLTEGGRAAALERFPPLRRRPAAVVSQGHYRGVHPATVGPEEARRRIGVEPGARVVTFFGLVRRYKGVLELLRAFRALPDRDVVLVVAGPPRTPALADEVVAAAGDDPRIRLRLELVPDDEVQLALVAADLVALPYTAVQNSSTALLALSFDRPVLVPDRGAMAELRGAVGGDWVRLFGGPLTPAALEGALTWAAEGRPGGAPLDAFSWPDVAARTVAAYRAALADRRVGVPG
jgi:glycosyltransferase involved in cell wall biosynthesis